MEESRLKTRLYLSCKLKVESDAALTWIIYPKTRHRMPKIIEQIKQLIKCMPIRNKA